MVYGVGERDEVEYSRLRRRQFREMDDEICGGIAETHTAKDKCCSNVDMSIELDDMVTQLGETFQQRLLRLVDKKGLSDVEVYKKANIDRKLFSKIRCNAEYKPKKKTAVALAIALELDLCETEDLLGRAEIALSPSNKFDLIIRYFIMNHIYDVYTINVSLFKYNQPILGE